ncbi:hypothetical protein CDN99_15560 [Roseateles aquatilis]|uniref:ParB-related ThiF-related cassette protein E domain-containing protein n=1 Tax=Roseateles aquatilis TaxID=431061 RepID=A0A246J9J9_9BURK|nr:PRTRC system protein E [Roseateles aquatilis]MBY0365423.1 PRTRC system protein E [Burkholderiaceae bacterium]OWQ88888.1 hypothetical protein CDN99_15560 [Roseateles aquatilis]
MTMFSELYRLALGATLTLTLSVDDKTGRMTVNVIPKPRQDAGEPALSTPLVLTATPEEFDADFVTVLSGYRAAHTSLAEQAQVTQELLDAAKAASAKKATGAVAKAQAKPEVAKPAAKASMQASDEGSGEGGDDLDDEAASAGGTSPARAAAAAPAPEDDFQPQLFG